jgi:hypothetical protein
MCLCFTQNIHKFEAGALEYITTRKRTEKEEKSLKVGKHVTRWNKSLGVGVGPAIKFEFLTSHILNLKLSVEPT